MRLSDPKAMFGAMVESLKQAGKQSLYVRAKAAWDEVRGVQRALLAVPGNIHAPIVDMGPISKGARKAAAQERLLKQRARFPDLALRKSAPPDALHLKFGAGDDVLFGRPRKYTGELESFADVGIEHAASDSWYKRPGASHYQRTHKSAGAWDPGRDLRSARALTLAGERNVTADTAMIAHGLTDDGSAILRKRGELPSSGHTVSASLVAHDHTGTFTASGYVYPYDKEQIKGAFTHDVASARVDHTGERVMNNGGSPLADDRSRSPGYVGALPSAQRKAGFWSDGTRNYNELFYKVKDDPMGVFVQKKDWTNARADVLQTAKDRNLPVMLIDRRGVAAMAPDDFFKYRDQQLWWSSQRQHPQFRGKRIKDIQTSLGRAMGPDATFFDHHDWRSWSDTTKEQIMALQPGRTFHLSNGNLRDALTDPSRWTNQAVQLPMISSMASRDIKTWNPLSGRIGRR